MSKKYNILLIATSKSRLKYFTKIKENTNLNIKIKSNPFSLNISNYFFIKNKINIEKVIKEKKRELKIKYSNKKSYVFFYNLYLKLITPFIVSEYTSYLKKEKVDIIGFWNGKKFPESLGVEIAVFFNVKTLFFENGLFPNTTVLDFNGVNATNSIPREYSFYQNYHKTSIIPKKLETRKELAKRIKEDIFIPKDYLFIPFQTNFDTQIIYHSNWINNMETLFNLIYQLSKKLKIYCLLKEHPSDRLMDYTYLHNKSKNNPYLFFANSIKTQNLIENASAIITINSSVGLEGLIFHKKIVVLGDAFYNIEHITKKASNYNELENIIKKLDNWFIDKKLINSFLNYINNEYLIKGDWHKANAIHFKEIENFLIKEIK